VENIRIISITEIGELLPNELKAWSDFLNEVNDPRAVFQIPKLYFKAPEIEERVNSLLTFLVFKSNELVGLFTFKVQKVQKKLKFGHFKIRSYNFNEIRSVGSGRLKDCTVSEALSIETQIISDLNVQSLFHNAYVFFEAIEQHDLFYLPKKEHRGFIEYELDQSQTFHLTFKPNFESFLQNKSKSKRHSIKKDLRRFEKSFENQFSIKDTHNGLSSKEFIESATAILNKSWKKGLVGSIVGSDGFSEQLTLLIQNGVSRIFILEVNNQPIAFAIGYRFNNNFFYEEIAYNEDFAKSGVGSYLTINVVKSLHNEGVRVEDYNAAFSFGVGDNIYKRKLCDEYIECKNLMLCTPRTEISIFFKLKGMLDYIYKITRTTAVKIGIHTKLRAKFKQRKQQN